MKQKVLKRSHFQRSGAQVFVACLQTRSFIYHLPLSVLFSSNYVFWKRIFAMCFSTENRNCFCHSFAFFENSCQKVKTTETKKNHCVFVTSAKRIWLLRNSSRSRKKNRFLIKGLASDCELVQETNFENCHIDHTVAKDCFDFSS